MQDAGAKHAAAREAEVEVERARADAERIAAALEAAYLEDSEQAISKHRRALAAARDELTDREHRHTARRYHAEQATEVANRYRVASTRNG